MIHAYINVPNPRLTVHGDPTCGFVQDMRSLDVPGPPFDAITCLFDSIGYPEDNDGIVATFAGAHRVVQIALGEKPHLAILGNSSPRDSYVMQKRAAGHA